MAVYAEKRNGRTPGVFIAEVMHLGVRVRKRFDTTRCPAAMPSSDPTSGGLEPTITIQLNTLGGQTYLVPLSVLAARGLLSDLALWPPAADVVPRQPLKPPKAQ
jgi:hypothetical protein